MRSSSRSIGPPIGFMCRWPRTARRCWPSSSASTFPSSSPRRDTARCLKPSSSSTEAPNVPARCAPASRWPMPSSSTSSTSRLSRAICAGPCRGRIARSSRTRPLRRGSGRTAPLASGSRLWDTAARTSRSRPSYVSRGRLISARGCTRTRSVFSSPGIFGAPSRRRTLESRIGSRSWPIRTSCCRATALSASASSTGGCKHCSPNMRRACPASA